MAASLSLSKAHVQTADALHEDVSVSIRANRAVVRTRHATVLEADVAAVRRIERRKWLVTLDDGSQWAVSQTARSCCGGRA